MPNADRESDLFGAEHLPEGFRYEASLLDEAGEQSLLAEIRELPFRDFEFHGFVGKRRVSPAFVARLQELGVSPLSVGRTIVATWEPNETVVLQAIRDRPRAAHHLQQGRCDGAARQCQQGLGPEAGA